MKTKKRKNSRAKGARIEREAAKFLTDLGFPTTRAARSGVKTGEDLIHDPGILANLHIEVKGSAALQPWNVLMDKAMQQAIDGAMSKRKRYCAVLWKHNGKPWALTFWTRQGIPFMVTVYDEMIASALRDLNNEPDVHIPGATACGCGECVPNPGGIIGEARASINIDRGPGAMVTNSEEPKP